MPSHSTLLELLHDLLAMLMFVSYLVLMVIIVVRVVMTRRAIGVFSWLILDLHHSVSWYFTLSAIWRDPSWPQTS